MVKERLLDGLENGTELGILQCKKGKVAVDCHPFRISKNHRTIEYGPPNQLVGSGWFLSFPFFFHYPFSTFSFFSPSQSLFFVLEEP